MPLDILAQIRADHAEVMRLQGRLARFRSCERAGKSDLVPRMVLALRAHCNAEDDVLYAACRREEFLADIETVGVAEHQLMDQMIQRLVDVHAGRNRSEAQFRTALRSLQRLFRQHAKVREERDWFKRIRKAFSAARLHRMGVDYRKAHRHQYVQALDSLTTELSLAERQSRPIGDRPAA